MNIIENHSSPDRLLRLIVARNDDGDVAIGFDGFAWHTHGDVLSQLSGLPEVEAIRQFIERITGDDQIIAVAYIDGAIRDAWPTDDPTRELNFKPPDESLVFRRWSGLVVPVEGE